MRFDRVYLNTLVKSFIDRVSPRPSYIPKELDIQSDVRGSQNWQSWSGKVGIYVFVNDKDFLYVGRAMKNTYLGKRIDDGTKINKDVEQSTWNKVINDPLTKIILYVFENENDDYWVAALELYLIDELQTLYNKRRG